ncbi:MAG: ThiF family adenylyltransferase, partial [Woeseiaceae bacterium]
KAEAAKRKIARINSQVRVTAIVDDVNYRNMAKYAAGADILVDGVDNFETRYLANDWAVKHGIPYIYGGAVGTVGASFAILPHTRDGDAPWETTSAGKATPCLRCIFEQAPPPGLNPTCETVGVIGPVVSIIANFEVAETLKVLTGNLDRVCPTMLNVDLWTNTIMQLKVARAWEAGDCPCCKHRRFEYLDGKAGSSATTLCGRDAVQLTHKQFDTRLDFDEIAARLRRHGKVTANSFMIRADLTDSGNSYELTLFTDGRAIVKGTGKEDVARSVYAKYIGT